MSYVEGKVAKLRASCDGCNESKVRCSQTKPQCGRCSRQGIACVYGLSRRSHRTAPRIGASQTSPTLESFLSGDTRQFLDTTGGTSASPSAEGGSAAVSRTCVVGRTEAASEVTAAFQEDEATATDRSLLTSTDLMPNFDMYAWQLADSGSLDLPASFELAFNPLNNLSAATSNLLGHYLPAPDSSPSVGGGGNRDSFFGSEVRDEPQSSANGPCNCNNLVVKQLLSLPPQSEEKNIALDTQFAQLKHAINVSEQCISCACTSQDEISIMTTSILIGRIIEGFEIFMARADPLSSPTRSTTLGGSNDSSPSVSVPRLSWGGLQIEPDEEAELKQHMWLIQLRKLQIVIKKLSVAVGLLRSAQDSGNSAHIMTCQCIHMWLVQKAEGLKDRYRVGDAAVVKKNAARQTPSVTETAKA